MWRRRDFVRAGAISLAALALPRQGKAEETLLQLGEHPQNLATPIRHFDSLITPTRVFFIRSHLGPPGLDPDRRLRLDGLVRNPLELRLPDLARFEQVSLTSVLQCAGNGRGLQTPTVPGVQWVHGAMGQAEWRGVRLSDLLQKAGVAAAQFGAAHVRLLGADLPPKPSVPRFIRSLPLDRALDRETLIATHMNGEPLTLAHGAPFRLVVPGWAGNHWVKWLTHLTVQEKEAEGFYYQTAYRMPKSPVAPGTAVPPDQMIPVTTIPVKSVIARPAGGGTTPRGRQEIAGVAFSGEGAIASVAVSLDDGATWTSAALEGEPGRGRWQVFRHFFDAKPGSYRAVARATDAKGNVQPREAIWNPSGYFWNGWTSVDFTVAG
ncbi:MAG: sulfite oxidase [Acidobacteria bacterium]|nr:sulfite oxidase [Acidobacteriota bacterium]